MFESRFGGSETAPEGLDKDPSTVLPEELEARQQALSAKFFSGLANPIRYRIVELLLEKDELNVSKIVDLTGSSQGQISNQLACLKWCGYVDSRNKGKFVYYRIADPRIGELLRLARAVVADNAQRIQACTRMG